MIAAALLAGCGGQDAPEPAARGFACIEITHSPPKMNALAAEVLRVVPTDDPATATEQLTFEANAYCLGDDVSEQTPFDYLVAFRRGETNEPMLGDDGLTDEQESAAAYSNALIDCIDYSEVRGSPDRRFLRALDQGDFAKAGRIAERHRETVAHLGACAREIAPQDDQQLGTAAVAFGRSIDGAARAWRLYRDGARRRSHGMLLRGDRVLAEANRLLDRVNKDIDRIFAQRGERALATAVDLPRLRKLIRKRGLAPPKPLLPAAPTSKS